MLALQASIGALNDLTDLTTDRRVKPAKPLVSGAVGEGRARAVVVVGLAVGLGLAAGSGPATTAIAAAGVGVGYAYDLRFKGSVIGPVAFAIGVPLLPVFAWLGAVGTLPPEFAVLIPAAVLAGLALAISNALADEPDDRATGVATIATRLGPSRAWGLNVAALAVMTVVAIGGLVIFGGAGAGVGLAIAGLGISAVGAVLARRPGRQAGRPDGTTYGRLRGRRRGPSGWELQAAGIAVLAIGWLLAVGLTPTS